MKMLAGQWWSNVDVWAIIVSSVVGILVGVLSSWATFRSANPKLCLQWWTVAQPPLFDSRFGAPITVSAARTTVSEPRIVQLYLANVGRKDITSSMFHGGEDIEFDFGSPIVAPLEFESKPEGTRLPDLDLSTQVDKRLVIKPAHIRRGQVITLAFLLDGTDVDASCVRWPLVDVDAVKAAPGERAREAGLTAYEVFRRVAPLPLPRFRA